MKFLALADTHLGFYYGRTAQAREYILQMVQNQFQYCLDKAVEHKVDGVIHAGDVFNRSQPKPRIVDMFYNGLTKVLDSGIELLVVPGNHDRGSLTRTLIEFYYPNYQVFNSLRRIDYNGTSVIGFPFERRPAEMFGKALQLARSDAFNLVVCHQTFYGATFGPHQFRFTYQDEVIRPPPMRENIQVVTGHIHKTQLLNNNQILYTGSTVRTSFVEIIEPKGFWIIDTDNLKVTFYEIPTDPMHVFEFSVKNGLKRDLLTDIDQLLPTGLHRSLLRLTDKNLSQADIGQIYATFDKETFPLLQITPNRPDRVLNSLYGNYSEIMNNP